MTGVDDEESRAAFGLDDRASCHVSGRLPGQMFGGGDDHGVGVIAAYGVHQSAESGPLHAGRGRVDQTMTLINRVHDGPVATVPIRLQQIPNMHAVFATNAAIGLRTIKAVDDAEWSSEDGLVEELRKRYADIEPEAL